jgi:hypothetical protein
MKKNPTFQNWKFDRNELKDAVTHLLMVGAFNA